MSVTIQDIAREANVSVATVSRVINNTKEVSPELKKRVRETIERNNFKPNSLARGLVTKKSHMIGIIVPDISNSVFGSIVKGINNVCQQKGYTLIVCESGGEKNKEIELLQTLSEKKIDGVLFAGVDVNAQLVDTMKTIGYPVVLITQEASDPEKIIETIVHDNVKAVFDAITFLIENGHREIAFICGPEHDFSSGKKRLQGYKKALEQNGIDIISSYIEYGDFSFESGFRCMRKIYEENVVLPTAVMACSDIMAIGAMNFIEDIGLKVPDNISVMGFDDSPIATYCTPKLSSVRISYFDEGVSAAKALLKLMGGKKNMAPSTHYMPHKVIRRKSVKNINL